MTNAPTPETDAFYSNPPENEEAQNFAQRLERERDEARSYCEMQRGNATDTMRELDELRNTPSNVIHSAACVTEWQKCEEERDQLRKVVDGIVKMLDDDVLVRNTDDDHDVSKFTAQGLRIVEVISEYQKLPHIIARNSPKTE